VVGRRSGWLALAAVAVGLTACGGGSDSNALTVYSGQHEQTMDLLTSDFTKRTGIEVKVRHNAEALLANQLLREGSASPADVFVTENSPALTVVERKGLYAPVRPATLAKTPSQYNSPKKDWVGVAARSAVLVYNPGKLDRAQLPSRLEQLEDPQWRGKIGFAPAASDFQPLVTAMGELNGAAAQHTWLEGMKRNGKRYDGNVVIVKAVDRGEISAGLIDHYYYYRTRDEIGASKIHARLHYFAPRDAGALVAVSGAAALKSSKHADEAQQFLAYLVSKPAQEIIATSQSYEYPLGSGVKSKRDIRPFSQLKPPDISVTDLGDGRGALRALQQVGLL
jgi:iron(III) transport system substrate-binding protein